MAKVFISATTADLGKARKVAELGLKTINLETVEQEAFETDYGKMLERLQRKLAGCDALVHIAGFRYGGEPDPQALPPGTPRRSYTQWEYHLAKAIQRKRKDFRIYAFLTADDYPTSAPPEDAERTQLQLEHRALLNPIKAATIRTDEQLREKCKEIQLAVEELQRSRRRWQWATAILAVPVLAITFSGGLSDSACALPGLSDLCKKMG